MSITYSFNSQKGYVEVVLQGVISDEEMGEFRMRYLDEAEAVRGMPELVDLTQADFSLITPARLQQLAEHAERVYRDGANQNVKVAFYTTDYLSSIMVSLYGDFVKDSIEEIRIFKDKHEAEIWLLADKTEMSYTIDLQKNIVFSRYGGYIRAKDLIDHIKTIRNDPDFHQNLNTIADIQTALLPEIFTEIMSIVNFIKSSKEERGEFKLALIIEESTVTRTAVVYEAMAVENHVKLCYDIEEAVEWVNQ